ncbi:CocE/NonD family hydrolase [Aquimarina sp. TRL1]|uniref:CocE/NonD family hydrolase n=1 Tax=Aquimarina sp. (strain TRL1) TaxID=2736252 RepID=UPI00158AE19A|nr:CocE/NonD family hydrolase [Aquimarina sp. TRL1]QKX07361.1 CocE/NonD family hydrolase [Aquimarina sp. TRL1]
MKLIAWLLIFLIGGCNSSTKTTNVNEYTIEDILIKTEDGGIISGILARKKGDMTPRPTILQYTIYVRDTGRDLKTLKQAVDHGYNAVIAYTRGKRFSPGKILPYEHDATDSYTVIDWISKQQWCDGRIGMYGGSYNGFTQWAATKKLHPALKTIVPYVANRPGLGLPMENNVFINPNYEWSFYVGNNKYLDTIVGNDRQRFRNMQNRWWETGVAYNKLDSIDGTPNPLFQRWIQHPSFDEYWQNMAPYKEDFSKITIPVLSIDGYYNDSQNSGLYYIREHYKYNPNAEHYLIIGPYGHFGAQRNGAKEINGYSVDKDALIDTNKITYQWFDYIFKKGKKPTILKDKINYQVMGANQWRSASSINKMNNDHLKLYLTASPLGTFYSLKKSKPVTNNFLYQEVDFADRETSNNNYYPDPIISDEIDSSNGFNFISAPLEKPLLVNGSFIGKLYASSNKKDFDFGVTLYEVMPNGTYFHLSYIVGRASYANDITQRKLLTPNKIEEIPFTNTHLVSKQLQKGSRLLIHLNINKNPFSELNYGTGKEVTTETITDATSPLKIKWYTHSYVEIPVWIE